MEDVRTRRRQTTSLGQEVFSFEVSYPVSVLVDSDMEFRVVRLEECTDGPPAAVADINRVGFEHERRIDLGESL